MLDGGSDGNIVWGMPQALFVGEFGGCFTAEFGMGPDRIVVEPPGAERHPCMAQGGEQRFVKTFIPQPAVEALAEAILLWLARRDVVPGDTALLRPAQDGHRGQLSAIAHYERGRPRIAIAACQTTFKNKNFMLLSCCRSSEKLSKITTNSKP